ncbi:hypothetical protein LVD17_22385 [Fulvivirga ulvae]|uniref:PIG-L deacetylase family protein n=1 Tax=Fulvivirga ulvae TaxID=2904245 RepID=UPI001F32D030|nr:PIG-L family deacetylase [Fulvivirga ulvae]UII31044.1 hypothetical protein LVD17_22385 [Fulvivirga ulvae]
MIEEYIKDRRLTFLSPHYDDVAFSLAGAMPKILAEAATCELINVFSTSNFVYENTHDIRYSTELRRKEDELALHTLGNIVLSYAGFDEALIRNNNRDALFISGPRYLHESDLLLKDLIAEYLSKIPEDQVVFIPAGFGGHIDHLILQEASHQLDHTKIYYSDLPYAGNDTLYFNQYAKNFTKNKVRITIGLSDKALELHLKVCKMYKTQYQEAFTPSITNFLQTNEFSLWV